jgi:glycosyltransferase involved in cell wall biosynthesis
VEYPRLLVVTSNNFNLVTGGGITMTNLFRGWPADRIANLHEDSQTQDETVCRNFYRLTEAEINLAWPFSMLSSNSNGERTPASISHADGRVVKISQMLFGDGFPRKFSMSTKLRNWLDDFRPEIIYSFLGSMAQIRVTTAVTNHCQASLAIHIMDDWPAVLYRRGLFGAWLRRIVISEFTGLLSRSQLCLAICPEMSEDYAKRFGYRFLPFHNAIDMSEWMPHSRQSWKAGSPFVIRYAGSILQEAQRNALRDICMAVSNMRRDGDSIEMWIHAPAAQRSYLEQLSLGGLRLKDSPDPRGIVQLLSSADLLVLPFNFDERSAQYVRLSMPTKIPAYMASGTPVLVYGPATIAPVHYAVREGWGSVVSKPGVHIVQEAIKGLMHDQVSRQKYAQRAQALALEQHDAAKVRTEFHSALMRAAIARGD